MKNRILGTIGFQILTLGLFSAVALGQTESAEKEKSQSDSALSRVSKDIAELQAKTRAVLNHEQGALEARRAAANAPYGDKGVEVQIESKTSLAGRTYTRKVKGNGYMGSPPPNVEFKHSIQFGNDNTVTDNGSSFFGNPPESGKYKIDGNTVVLELRGVTGNTYTEKYTLSDDGLTITGEAGAVLTVSLTAKTYSRTFTGQPMGAPKPMEFTHSVKFSDDETATDNGSSFFGNPPETGKYKVSGNTVVIELRGVTGSTYSEKYALSKDLKTLTNEAGAVLTVKN